MHTIYGRRFPIGMESAIGDQPDWLLPELNPGSVMPAKAGIQRKTILPVLNIDAYLKGIVTIEALQELVAGFKKIVVSVDEDSQTILALSPRFGDESSRAKVADQVASLISELARLNECIVALTVEELCPGGLDATDGIALAEQFVNAGACAIIASGGTNDFLPLKVRRPTTLKAERQEGKDPWPEPWLSSAVWLIGRVNVPVYAQGIVSDLEHTLPLAAELGLAGIIDTSVKHPSSPLTMSKG